MRLRLSSHEPRVTRVARGVLLALLTLPLFAEGQGRASQGPGEVPYNGKVTFTRIRYGSSGFRRGGGAWAHDYPNADRHLSTLLEYLTTISMNVHATNVFDLDDPEIFKHPIIYLSEPGYWEMSEEEAYGLRDYLLKGGFLILDDFEREQWYNMEAQLQRALPELHLVEIGPEHPVFKSFFAVENIYVPHAMYQYRPSYFALFENNDPTRRIMALVNFNSDLAEYWEWSDQNFFPMDLSNEAYKLGVNYILYGLTH